MALFVSLVQPVALHVFAPVWFVNYVFVPLGVCGTGPLGVIGTGPAGVKGTGPLCTAGVIGAGPAGVSDAVIAWPPRRSRNGASACTSRMAARA